MKSHDPSPHRDHPPAVTRHHRHSPRRASRSLKPRGHHKHRVKDDEVLPKARLVEPILYYMPSCWQLVEEEGDCDWFECPGCPHVAVEHACMKREPGSWPEFRPQDTLAERENDETTLTGPIVLLRTGFWLAHYASREPEPGGSGVRHFAELCMAPEPDRVAVVRYQAVLPHEPRELDPFGFQMHLLRRCAVLTRLLNPLEAAWFKHPEDAPPGFLEPRFAYVVKAKERKVSSACAPWLMRPPPGRIALPRLPPATSRADWWFWLACSQSADLSTNPCLWMNPRL